MELGFANSKKGVEQRDGSESYNLQPTCFVAPVGREPRVGLRSSIDSDADAIRNASCGLNPSLGRRTGGGYETTSYLGLEWVQ